jgi:hypothetical protein
MKRKTPSHPSPRNSLPPASRLPLSLALLLAFGACGEGTGEPGPAVDSGDVGSDVAADAGADATDQAEPVVLPSTWAVGLSDDAPDAVRWAADDLVGYLRAMGLEVADASAEVSVACAEDIGRIVLLGDGLGDVPEAAALTPQTWSVEEAHCGSGRLVTLAGGGLLGRQYAVYEYLHHLGVRFFHPEQEYVPSAPAFTDAPWSRTHTPAFTWRSVSLHLTHPLELGDAFNGPDDTYHDEGVRYIAWQVKNGASHGHGGIGSGEYAEYGHQRGFRRGAGLGLHGVQQGSRPLIDPDDPRTEEEQIAAAIEVRMNVEHPPETFGVSFNESEFTLAPDTDIVRQLTFIANYFAEHYPTVELMTTNHGTHQEPTENYGVRSFDLPQFAPPNLGVSVHTLMFYDLERPAPVYGNENFHFLFDFMEQEYQVRNLWYFPESAWWLTFDNAVPLYLPITIEARDRDIQKIAFMLEGGLTGHRVFGSGHEWGYWQNEYCSLRMAADLEYRWTDCLADITGPMGEAGAEVQAVLEAVVAHQETVFFDADLLGYLAGSDPETEVAAAAGIHFHPLAPAARQVVRWTDAQVNHWSEAVEPVLREMDSAYASFLVRLDAVRDTVAAPARPFFDEIYDGIAVTGLRARHAWQLYGALVALRAARTDGGSEDAAEALLDEALATTEDAIAVIHRREAGYRYQPLARSIAGGPDGTEDDNWTIYDFRVHNRAHHGYYYVRADRQAIAEFAGTGDAVTLADAIVEAGAPHALRLAEAADGADVRWGDDVEDTDASGLVEHTYGAPGVYTVTVVTPEAEVELALAQVEDELTTGFSGTVVEPEGADILEGVLPGLVFGVAGDQLALGFAVDASSVVGADGWTPLTPASGGDTALNAPADVIVPIVNRTSADVIAAVTVRGARLDRYAGEGDAEHLAMRGQLGTDDIVAAIVSIGGFDEGGARRIVASTLGYTPSELPELVSFEVEYTIEGE